MSTPTYRESVPTESPLLWPALLLFVIAVGCFVSYWDGHRAERQANAEHKTLIWPPPPEAPGAAAASKI